MEWGVLHATRGWVDPSRIANTWPRERFLEWQGARRSGPRASTAPPFRVFLLSPADCSGRRARLLQKADPVHDLGRRLHGRDGAELGEVFSFLSSLYFRGKLAYARAFARPPRGQAGIHVITPCDGLLTPESPLRATRSPRYADVPVDAEEARYRQPLLQHLHALAPAWVEAEVVLLGSVASRKYVELLTSALGDRVSFPSPTSWVAAT